VVSPSQDKTSPAPKDYDDFYRRYAAYVRRLLILNGIPASEADEQVSHLFTRWMTTGMLAVFNPDFESEREPGPARFEPFLHQHVRLAARGIKGNIYRRQYREPVVLDQPVSPTLTLLDIYDSGEPESRFGDIEYANFVDTVHAYLETIPRRSSKDVCDLPLLFNRVVAQVETLGKIDKRLLMEGPWEPHEERGVVKTTISFSATNNWLKELRRHVGDAIELFGLSRKGSW
jgi:hypothetical protein